MKLIRVAILLSVSAFFLCSCVSRTTYDTPEQKGASVENPERTVKEKKIVWIWQSEFYK